MFFVGCFRSVLLYELPCDGPKMWAMKKRGTTSPLGDTCFLLYASGKQHSNRLFTAAAAAKEQWIKGGGNKNSSIVLISVMLLSTSINRFNLHEMCFRFASPTLNCLMPTTAAPVHLLDGATSNSARLNRSVLLLCRQPI